MKTKHLEVKEGSISIPIYEFSDGRCCVDTVLRGKRKRITRASLDAAKIEARRLLAQIGSGRQAEELLSISEAEAEDYRLAKEKLAPHGTTLLTAVEEWIGFKAKNLRLLLSNAPAKLLPLFAIGAFAGLRTRKIVRLEWSDIRFEQGVIEAAERAKTEQPSEPLKPEI